MKIATKVDSYEEDRMISLFQIREKDIGFLSKECRFIVKTLTTFQTKVKYLNF